MTPLYAMMHLWASRPFVWGEHDCALGLADWLQHLRGVDTAAHLRGQYFDALSCQRFCGWFTDPVRVIEECLATVGGLPRVEAPQPGDVAVLILPQPDRDMPVGAIWLGDCWGCKGPDGVTTLAGGAVNAWAIWGVGYAA
ncbi:hypothetical protein [uncultured Mameliella sp.]|mgnify:CR=1 FL=1|uniref:DUF6950 family protein n=1 Tax=uncultured Mameliella sp. TaxID=1447087 RepID=UPI002611796E|nr:hypothetical protein [uncultured Mameliella sp.]